MDYDLLCAQLKGLAEAERWYVPLLSNAACHPYLANLRAEMRRDTEAMIQKESGE